MSYIYRLTPEILRFQPKPPFSYTDPLTENQHGLQQNITP